MCKICKVLFFVLKCEDFFFFKEYFLKYLSNKMIIKVLMNKVNIVESE